MAQHVLRNESLVTALDGSLGSHKNMKLLAAAAAAVCGQAGEHGECQGNEGTGNHRPGSPGRSGCVMGL